MNDIITLAKITFVVEKYASYGPEDYQEVEQAVHRGLELAKLRLMHASRCPACGSIDVNAFGVCTHCGTKAAN